MKTKYTPKNYPKHAFGRVSIVFSAPSDSDSHAVKFAGYLITVAESTNAFPKTNRFTQVLQLILNGR